MATETFLLYKLIILYILSRVDFPLTNAQISGFMLDKEYTSYFNIQQAVSELTDDTFIITETIRNSSLYRITDSGRETLEFFGHMISPAIKDDIEAYLAEHKYTLLQEVSSPAFFEQVKKGEYIAHLKVMERGSSIIDLSINVTSEEEASHICNNWKENSSEVYQMVLAKLLS